MTGSKPTLDDEILMRFADGELDDASMRLVERTMEQDEGVAERVAMFMETRLAAQQALAPLLAEPVPADVLASVQEMVMRAGSDQGQADIIDLQARRKTARRVPIRWSLPIAASLVAAVIGGVVGYMAATPSGTSLDFRVAGAVEGDIATALATVATGGEAQLQGGRFRSIATFVDGAGKLCREFEFDRVGRDTVVSVACNSQDGWNLHFAVLAPAGSDGYAPASSVEALDAYLAAIDAGQPLDAGQEQQALSGLR